MIAHRCVRAPLRAGVVGLAVSLPLLGGAAYADDPATFDNVQHVSALEWLLVLLIIPGGVALLIALFTVLPSMIGRDSAASDRWNDDGTWFGGPSEGVDAASPAEGRTQGGAGGQF